GGHVRRFRDAVDDVRDGLLPGVRSVARLAVIVAAPAKHLAVGLRRARVLTARHERDRVGDALDHHRSAARGLAAVTELAAAVETGTADRAGVVEHPRVLV